LSGGGVDGVWIGSGGGLFLLTRLAEHEHDKEYGSQADDRDDCN
jgi:hypothetical protein